VHHYDWDYVAENPQTTNGFGDFGCQEGANGNTPQWVNPPGTEFRMTWDECYTHDSLVTDADCSNGSDYCDRPFGGLSSVSRWRYYTPTPEIIWDAPAGIPEVCYGENDLTEANEQVPCGTGGKSSQEWADHVALPYGAIPYNHAATYTNAPIFDDLYNCSQEMPATWRVGPGPRFPYTNNAGDPSFSRSLREGGAFQPSRRKPRTQCNPEFPKWNRLACPARFLLDLPLHSR
jgi:hypothetical protein